MPFCRARLSAKRASWPTLEDTRQRHADCSVEYHACDSLRSQRSSLRSANDRQETIELRRDLLRDRQQARDAFGFDSESASFHLRSKEGARTAMLTRPQVCRAASSSSQ